jgi:hypothetical protein
VAGKKTAKREVDRKGAEKPEVSLAQLGKLSKEELLIKLGQLLSENAALREQVRRAAKNTALFHNAAQTYLRQPLEDTMRDHED